MDALSLLGIIFILIIVFFIGMVVGGIVRQASFEQSGYRITYTPNADRKYMIQDLWQDMNNAPSHNPYESLFRKQ